MRRRAVSVGIVCAVLVGLLGPAVPQALAKARVAPIQRGLIDRLQSGALDSFVVEFAARADLRAAAATKGWAARGLAVHRTLTGVAKRSQAAARAVVGTTAGARAESFWLTNVLVVTDGATPALARRLAGLAGVKRIRAERTFPLVEPVERHSVRITEDEPPPWGVMKIGADDVWAEGILGSGVVVANIDTGVDYTHEALVEQYRGNLGGSFDHDYSWWDPTGICGDEPCDNAEHGTHTMGTMVGGDGPGPFTPDIGVAPGATWIAAKGCEDLFCSETSLLSSGEFVLAPTDLNGDDPDPTKRPDIVNNSWGGGPGDPFYAEVVTAWRAAGIIPVFSAGNAGPDCDSGGSPGDFLESFSAGATDENDEIADFSSRGPSTYGKVNPDVSAPGVDVVSSVPGDGYDAFSGTSMAAPHTSGTLALILSAELGLLGDVDGATDAVRSTALDLLDDSCGGDDDGDPNNVFGDGRIDAQAAVALVATGGTLAGDVSDVVTTDPIEGARVEATSGGRTFATTTDSSGHFEVFLGAGSYTVTASAFAYQSALATGVEIETDLTTTQDFFLAPLPQRDITGTVTAEEDGTPIEGAEVRALGTPVAPAITDANGEYTLTLPIGDHTIRIAAGGCTSSAIAEVTLGLAGLVYDAALSRKLDDFGHGCRGIAFDWVDAANRTALFGDQTTGRLPLPFSFPFYGESYDVVYMTDNGYVTFEAPEDGFPDPTPGSIPSTSTPNTAIYALWQNLVIDDDSSIRFDTVGSSPDRAFVIEYEQMKVGPRFGDLGADAEPAVTGRIDVEVKLWEDGRIDLLYGDNPANPGDGRDAGIGIENEDGTDALQFSFSDDLLGTNVAYRYELVPTGTVTGTVTDANDGMPIGGAVVTAQPGGRSASTAADGTYSIRLRPGTYDVSIAADDYVTHEEADVGVTDDGSTVVDAALLAPVAGVEPTELDASVDFGDSSTAPITISNTGSSDLTWELLEREGSRVPPDLPPVPFVVRAPTWGPAQIPARVATVRPAALPPAALETVIDDPDDDSRGSVEVTAIRGGSDNAELSVAIDFSLDTPMDQPAGYMFFDTDQDPETGFPPEEFAGLPEQDIGLEYFADLFGIHDPDDPVVLLWDANTFELVAEVPATIEGRTLSFALPLEALGNDDGTVDVASVIGDFAEPLDWAPDEGHGTVRTFTDAPWIEPSVASGVVAAGETADVDVTLGGPDVQPGEYTGALVLISDAPKQPALEVDVTLAVGLPENWGEATGTVLDAHTFEPIQGATISVETTWDGDPLVLSDTSDGEGLWSLLGPPGGWPAEVTGEGYLDETTEVTIVADGSLEGQDVFLHADQPHGTIRPGSLRFTLLRGRQDEQVLRLGNLEGHRDLSFEVGEVAIPPPSDGGEEPPEPLSIPQNADANATDSRATGHTSPGHTGIGFEGEVIAEWDTEMNVPWGVGYRNGPDMVTLSDPEDLIDVEFTPAGDRMGEFDTPWVGEWAADLAWDAGRGLLWHVNVGGDNGIYGIDPTDGSVVETVTGSGWGDISQRGLAYDRATDTFYIGGWNEGIVYHVAGPSWPEPGETLDSCSPEDPNISGLAWNPAFHKLWVATNSEFDDIWLIDPDTCEPENVLVHPDPGFNGAGLELDAAGNLWTVSQGSQTAYLIESGLPTFSDVPWLDVTPTEGVVEPGDKAKITVSVDSTGLSPGVHQAFVGLVTDDPDLGVATVRVRLLVTKYQRFVNVGGDAVTFQDGTRYVGDRRFAEGRFGWAGESSVRTTNHPLAGTPYPSVFRVQREGMGSYKFSVPKGRYRVQLEFAELAGLAEFGRIMDISGEGQLRFNNLDIAGRVGRWRALSVSFDAQVRDGLLVVRFARALGAPPVLNGIRVTWLRA